MSKRTIVASAVAVIAVAVLTACNSSTTGPKAGSPTTSSSTSPNPSAAEATTQPPVALKYAAKASCTYPGAEAAAKPVKVPSARPITSITEATLTTNRGVIGITLDPKAAPCTVNSFVSLARQGYFNSTPCHRLTTAGIYVLQCGDPTGQGTGGPGYGFANELAASAKPKSCNSQYCIYPAGTVAMAHSALPNSNGSQFFLVYQDSPLPYDYTIFGRMSATGIAAVKQIAAQGSDNSNGDGDGAPNEAVAIEKATVR